MAPTLDSVRPLGCDAYGVSLYRRTRWEPRHTVGWLGQGARRLARLNSVAHELRMHGMTRFEQLPNGVDYLPGIKANRPSLHQVTSQLQRAHLSDRRGQHPNASRRYVPNAPVRSMRTWGRTFHRAGTSPPLSQSTSVTRGSASYEQKEWRRVRCSKEQAENQWASTAPVGEAWQWRGRHLSEERRRTVVRGSVARQPSTDADSSSSREQGLEGGVDRLGRHQDGRR
jgi:hypothetical protein